MVAELGSGRHCSDWVSYMGRLQRMWPFRTMGRREVKDLAPKLQKL